MLPAQSFIDLNTGTFSAVWNSAATNPQGNPFEWMDLIPPSASAPSTVTVTGFTTGAIIAPYTVSFNFYGMPNPGQPSVLRFERLRPTGGDTTALSMEIIGLNSPPLASGLTMAASGYTSARTFGGTNLNSGTRLETTITIGGYVINSANLTFRDIDIMAPGNFGWQDEIVFNTPGGTLTRVNTTPSSTIAAITSIAYTTGTFPTATGAVDNSPNDATRGNVIASLISSPVSALNFVFRESALSEGSAGTDGGRVGFTTQVTILDASLVPEPSQSGLIAALGAALFLRRRRNA